MTTPTTVNVRLQLRADTAANWTAANPILLANEVGLETDTKKLKVGNGSSAWNSLAYFPSIVSGGTVLGNLEIGSTGTLTFEGSTADGFETTLAVTNPTADRTITLPNQSGTVVVSGNASIVDADIAANAEIAVSKLANGTANQVIVTDGTNVSWSDDLTLAGNLTVNGTTTTINTETLVVEDKNIELGVVDTPSDTTADGGGITLKGTTDKTINWYDATDAWTSSERFSVPLGSASSPSLTFTGDENTGIYSPGADQLALSTNGAEALRIDADGNVLIGVESSVGIGNLQVVDLNAPGKLTFARNDTTIFTGNTIGTIAFYSNADDVYGECGRIDCTPEASHTATSKPTYLTFRTTPSGSAASSERLRITSAGLVGIGSSSPRALLDLSRSTDGLVGTFGRPLDYGLIQTDTTLHLTGNHGNGNGPSITFSEQNVTVGASTGRGVRVAATRRNQSADYAMDLRLKTARGTDGVSVDSLILGHDYIAANTSGFERARIDSSGRLLVGTSSARSNFYGGTTEAPQLQIEGTTYNTASLSVTLDANSTLAPRIVFGKTRGTAIGSNTVVQSGDQVGTVVFQGSDGSGLIDAARITCEVDGTPGANDMPGRLVFSSTPSGSASPVERMRITSGGLCLFGLTGVVAASTATIQASGASKPAGLFNRSDDGDLITFHRNGSSKVGSISVTTSATAYNTSSDYRLKENVTPVTDGITRLQQLKPSRFNFIADPNTVVDGFIAHEVQAVVPEAITGEKDAVDENGDPVYQGIDQSKLVPLLTAALQEAIGEIESLKARVAALESA